MPYRIGSKFVSKEVYDAHMQQEAIEAFADKESPVTEENTTDQDKPRKPRTTDPVTIATVRVRKARKELDRVKAVHEKRAELPSIEDAQFEYDSARSALSDVLDN